MDIVKRSWRAQRKIEERAKRIGRGKYGQVLHMARKPEMHEYIRTLQLVGAGLLMIGLLGFAIYYIMVFMIPDLISSFSP
ncbi:MAG: protein translocase SEC61 complex subunit gamma [Thermoplasmata archaeon]